MNFPIESYPPVIQNLLIDLPRVVGSRPEYGGLAALWAGSIIVADQKIKVQEGWELNTNLYAAIVAPKGDAKSPALNLIINPLTKHFNKKAREHLEKMEIWEKEMAIAKSARVGSRAEMIRQCEEKKPKTNWWGIVTEGTTEGLKALAERHHISEQPPRIGYHAEELDGWLQNMSRYTDGSDKAFWLAAFDGDATIKVNKGEQSSCPPFTMSLIGTIQPKIFSGCFNGSNTDNGLLDRFMVAVHLDENTKEHELFQSWGAGVLEAYSRYMRGLIDPSEDGEFDEHRPTGTIEFPESCREIASEFNSWIIKMDNRTGAGASSKWRQHYFKVCAILAALWEKDYIDEDIAKKASDLTKYFVKSWCRCFKSMAKTDFAEIEDQILEILEREGECTQREIIRKFSSSKRKIVIESLETLYIDNLIAIKVERSKNGRETTVYSPIESKEVSSEK